MITVDFLPTQQGPRQLFRLLFEYEKEGADILLIF